MITEKCTQIEQIFYLANGRPKPSTSEISYFDFVFPCANKFSQLDEAGKLYAVDKNGVKRLSTKDPRRSMNAIEYFEELKSHPVFEFCFASKEDNSISGEISQEDLSKLSRAERLTRFRKGNTERVVSPEVPADCQDQSV